MVINEEELRAIIREEIADHLGLNEMARVGVINTPTKYDVQVWTDDAGYIPHVHIMDWGTRGKKFDCCVKLETNEFFPHGKHKSLMNKDMMKAFDTFMRQPSRNIHYRNNYEAAVNLWNDNNSNSYVQLKEDENGNVIIPDYSNILTP